jgi:hypothetical protein
MKYLIYNTKKQATARTRQIAIEQGCSGVTTEWFGILENGEQAALQIPEEETDKLKEQEIQSLKDEEYMRENGWFNESDN